MPDPITRDRVTRREYDLADFDERDERDAADTERARAAVSGLPARPGTRR